jgi:hypothetical protein
VVEPALVAKDESESVVVTDPAVLAKDESDSVVEVESDVIVEDEPDSAVEVFGVAGLEGMLTLETAKGWKSGTLHELPVLSPLSSLHLTFTPF